MLFGLCTLRSYDVRYGNEGKITKTAHLENNSQDFELFQRLCSTIVCLICVLVDAGAILRMKTFDIVAALLSQNHLKLQKQYLKSFSYNFIVYSPGPGLHNATTSNLPQLCHAIRNSSDRTLSQSLARS